MQLSTAREPRGFFGQRVADHFGMHGQAVSEFRLDDQIALATTRLTCGRRFRERTDKAHAEGAFSILYQVDDLDHHACWLGGQQQRSGRFLAKSVNVVDLGEDPQWQFRGRFDAFHYYVPRDALATVAAQHGGRTASTLRWEEGVRDEILWGLSQALVHAAACAGENQMLIDQIGLSLLTHFAGAYGGVDPEPAARFGQLAAWQLRRAKEMMLARLASSLTIAQVASECRLTPSHFARAFRRSTGVAPQRYLTQLRIAEAKRHLSQQHLPLSDIALMCGFGDQSHFTRVFRQLAGTSPGAWRRSQSHARAAEGGGLSS